MPSLLGSRAASNGTRPSSITSCSVLCESLQQCSGSASCLSYLLRFGCLLLLSSSSHFSAECHKVHDYMLSYFLKGDFLSRPLVLASQPITCTSQGSKSLPKVRVTTYVVILSWPNILYTVPIIKFPPINGELLKKEKSLDLTQINTFQNLSRVPFCSTLLLSTIQNTILPFM